MTAEQQFTPGPYRLHGKPRDRFLAVIDSIPDVDGKVVANCICHVALTNPSAEANARLIAAAPELYAACKALSDFQAEYQRNALDAMPGNEHYSFKLVAIVESARQALAAADGGGE